MAAKIQAIWAGTSNPLPLLMDYARPRTRPYVARTRDGLIVELRPGRGDRYCFYEVLLRRNYLRHPNVIKPGSVVVDVGANIGCFSLLASRLAGAGGKVVAVEPSQETYRQLCGNLQRNHADNVVACREAVAGQGGTIRLNTSTNALFSSI